MIALAQNDRVAFAHEEINRPDEMNVAKATGSATSREEAMQARQNAVVLLQKSFALVRPQAGIAALVFYRNLFALDPSLRALFKSDIELQGRKLMEALDFTIASIENPKALEPVLESMGRRHVAYGVRDEHYGTVLQAMLQTLGELLGKEFTPEARQVWTEALTLVAKTMMRGAAPVTALKQAAQ